MIRLLLINTCLFLNYYSLVGCMVTIIIGNGFDLNLMLRTSYSDFAKSKEFRDLPHSDFFRTYVQSDDKEKSLWAHLQSVFFKQNWFDIEDEIYSFARINREPSFVFQQEFELIKKALQQYILRIVKCTNPSENSLAYRFINDVVNNCTTEVCIYSFNYTDCLSLCNCTNHNQVKLYNIHGNLSSDIVLGYYDYMNKITDNLHGFMDKSFMLKKGGFNIEKRLIEADEVIFFGHSLNPMDFSFFKPYFDHVKNNSSLETSLTFVTFDDKSTLCIKNNLKKQGYDLRGIYDHLNNFDFIRTNTWNECNIDDITTYNQLIHRITSM